jgi:hypothetical protein
MECVVVSDAVAGTALETLTNSGPVYTLDWSPDGSQLVYGGARSDGQNAEPIIVPAPSPCATTIAATDTFTLINADTMQPVQPLNDGDTIDLSTLTTSNLTIRANTVPGIVGSVVFDLNSILAVQTDDTSPYDLTNWTPAVGSYTLTSTPYSEACGTAGIALTINFTIVDSGACDVNVTANDTALLISAITAGNTFGAPYTICLTNSSYTLNQVDNEDVYNGDNALPVITGDITIVGNGVTIMRDGAAPAFRFFHVAPGGSLTLENVTLSNGSIYNDGVFEAINIRFDDALTCSFLVEEPMSVDTCLIVDDSE